MPGFTRLLLTFVLALAPTGCGIAVGSGHLGLTVLINASLTNAFGELGPAYQRTHKDVTVHLSSAGAHDLASQVVHWGPGDVIVTADRHAMDELTKKVTGRRVIAHSALTIAVAPGNPEKIKGLADLADPRLRVVIGVPTIPVGRYARSVLSAADVRVRPAAEEADARAILTRIRTGKADAGLVYLTDVKSAGAATDNVPIPAGRNVTAAFVAATVEESSNADAAGAFVAWLTSDQAETILKKYGFQHP